MRIVGLGMEKLKLKPGFEDVVWDLGGETGRKLGIGLI